MEIDVRYNAFFGQKEISYPVAFIDNISERRRGGKSPAYIYSIVTKAGNKKERLFKIPERYMNKEKQFIIKNKLETLTGFKVVTSRFRFF